MTSQSKKILGRRPRDTDEAPLPDDSPTGAAESSAGSSDQGASGVAVVARNLHLTGKRGPVYGPIDLTVRTGELLLVTGPAGSGRTIWPDSRPPLLTSRSGPSICSPPNARRRCR